MFKEVSAVLGPLGLRVVDVRREEHRDSLGISITITTEDHRAGIDECAKAHRIILPRLSVLEGERDIELEVSTPGIQRVFRDVYEFSLFAGKRCRIYDSGKNAWIEGIIEGEQEDGVVLTRVSVEDSTEAVDRYHIPYGHIKKARLAYAWEDVPRCPVN